MQAYAINVSEIEELQTIANRRALDLIFTRAQQTITGGEKVLLQRVSGAKKETFDEISTLEDLAAYRQQVYKYL